MQYKNKFFLFVIFFILLSHVLFSQVISDPGDRIYRFLTLWQERGFISRMPVIRPYSLQIIVKMLKEVEEKGDAASQEQAKQFRLACTEPNFRLGPNLTFPGPIHMGFEQKSLLDFSGYAGMNTFQFNSTGFISPYASYSGRVSIGIIDNTNQLEPLKWSSFFDEARTGGGVVNLGDRVLGIGQNGLAGLFWGNETIGFQAGLMRTAFGPFFDNGPVLTPEAPAAGHFSFTYEAPWYSFSSIYLDLYARYYVESNTGIIKELSAATATAPVTKYLVLHNARFFLADWFNLGIIQSNMCGGVFNPVYLIPLQQAFFTQQFYGDQNNSILGFFGEVTLPFALHFNTIMYVDDWDSFSTTQDGSNRINFDSAQNKFSLQTGLSWSPCYGIFKQLKTSYLMITPYMYTHSSFSPLSYLTYTHAGANLGSTLEPNSDQLQLNLFLMPFSWMNVDIQAKYTRHGNASTGYEEAGVNSDGTVFDDGFNSAGSPTFVNTTSRFLTQSVLEQVLQLGLALDCPLSLFFTRINGKLGYTFQYTWNKGLIEGNNELKHYLELKLLVEL